jgi:hypothetical protein
MTSQRDYAPALEPGQRRFLVAYVASNFTGTQMGSSWITVEAGQKMTADFITRNLTSALQRKGQCHSLTVLGFQELEG